MIFTNTNLKGLVVIEPEYHFDERGFFSRIVCQDDFKQHGLENTWLQQNISFNKDKGTLRGMHLQKGEAAEIKIVRCMPNTPVSVGEGMTGICRNELVTDTELETILNMFETIGKAEIVDEKCMDAVVAVSGSSPAYIYILIEAMADAAVLEGLSREKAYCGN